MGRDQIRLVTKPPSVVKVHLLSPVLPLQEASLKSSFVIIQRCPKIHSVGTLKLWNYIIFLAALGNVEPLIENEMKYMILHDSSVAGIMAISRGGGIIASRCLPHKRDLPTSLLLHKW